jgi:hypothetical protein
MKALIVGAAAATGAPLSLLLPARQAGLFRWCLSRGLRVVKPMTLTAMGAYTPQTEETLRRLAALRPKTLALMHGSTYVGDGGRALLDLATAMRELLAA